MINNFNGSIGVFDLVDERYFLPDKLNAFPLVQKMSLVNEELPAGSLISKFS